jgi:quinolinate synthase
MTEEGVRKEIKRLKETRNAVILAHNYQPPQIQDIADMTGDSLELSRKAVSTAAQVIVFCGVGFMAETAAILNPGKIVLLPRLEAGCPMADMIGPEDMKSIKEQHPQTPIVTYVNSSAAVKAESTICCTSANSIQVVESFQGEESIYMAPDMNLAQYTARHTEKKIHYWNGYCPIHHNLTAEMVMARKKEHPDALFLAHPECRPEVLDLADIIQSTSGMLRFVNEDSRHTFIVGTEMGILHPMSRQNPGKRFYPASDGMLCPDMKMVGLEDVLLALETLQPQITISEDIRVRALAAVERMIAI